MSKERLRVLREDFGVPRLGETLPMLVTEQIVNGRTHIAYPDDEKVEKLTRAPKNVVAQKCKKNAEKQGSPHRQ